MHRALRAHPRLVRLCLYTLLLALALAFKLAPADPLYAQSDEVLRIVEADLNQFPEMKATVSYSSAHGVPLPPPENFLVELANTQVSAVSAEPVQLPLAVSFVVDLSPRMSDRGAPFSTRFDTMLPLLRELVDRLAAAQHKVSLITFSQTPTLAHTLTPDLGAVRNTINRVGAKPSFAPAALDAAAPGDPYPLVDAVRAGLDQLATADPSQPLVLVIFAAGAAAPPAPDELRDAIAASRAGGRPVRVLVFGFGSPAEGAFERFPAGPDGLQQLAAALDGDFFDIADQPIAIEQRRAIDQAYTDILRRAEHTRLSFSADGIPDGAISLRISAGDATDELALDLDTLSPRFNVVVDTRNFQDRVQLLIATKFVQTEIISVEYLLDNRLITTAITAGPDFRLELNAYDPVFQSRFNPGEYQLNAIATDSRGNKSPSEEIFTVTVFAAPAPVTPPLTPYWWVALPILALAGGAAALWRRQASRAGLAPAPARPARQTDPMLEPGSSVAGDDWITGSLESRNGDEDQPTAELLVPAYAGDTPTAELPTAFRAQTRWFLHVVDGDDLILPDGSATRRVELTNNFTDIGRSDRSHLRVAKHYEAVSRRHVTLELFLNTDFIGLTDHESRHGTFIGDSQAPLDRGRLTHLNPGQIFSLADQIKLRVEQEKP